MRIYNFLCCSLCCSADPDAIVFAISISNGIAYVGAYICISISNAGTDCCAFTAADSTPHPLADVRHAYPDARTFVQSVCKSYDKSYVVAYISDVGPQSRTFGRALRRPVSESYASTHFCHTNSDARTVDVSDITALGRTICAADVCRSATDAVTDRIAYH